MEAISAVRSLEVKPTGAAAPGTGLGLSLPREPEGKKGTSSALEPRTDSAQVEEKTREKIERIAQMMDEYLKSIRTSLNIQVNSQTGKVVVKVISENDGRTIREIPPEELLNLAARMEEMMGLLFNERV